MSEPTVIVRRKPTQLIVMRRDALATSQLVIKRKRPTLVVVRAGH
tara:strand:+ start:30543 stop:30677 length:135 start_codon:yes stop_codon:yes gene_type:complete